MRPDPIDQFGQLIGATTEVQGGRQVHLECHPRVGVLLRIEERLGPLERVERQIRSAQQPVDPASEPPDLPGLQTVRIDQVPGRGEVDQRFLVRARPLGQLSSKHQECSP